MVPKALFFKMGRPTNSMQYFLFEWFIFIDFNYLTKRLQKFVCYLNVMALIILN